MSTSTVSNKERNLFRLVTAISIALPLIVFALNRVRVDIISAPEVYTIPLVNAILNGASAVVLIFALIFVKMGRIDLHSKSIYLAMLLSTLFLVGYIIYHLSTDPTSYGGDSKTMYYTLLISHVILAGIQAPFVLFAFLYGYLGKIDKHKRLVKISYPMWLYISITGVICYVMIAPYYGV
ncbi:MAG: DUF420 domain-containing protein [Saprospiraceae bacterium]|nr:DUF420 domain-containing protein [Saprospiraceae bacterium]